MVGWHHHLIEHELEQALGDSEGQGSLACCSPLNHRIGHNSVTEQQKFYLSPCRSVGDLCCVSTVLILSGYAHYR